MVSWKGLWPGILRIYLITVALVALESLFDKLRGAVDNVEGGSYWAFLT